MITLDTSALLAIVDRRQRHHQQCLAAVSAMRVAPILPVGILAEFAYLAETRLPRTALVSVLEDIAAGNIQTDCGEQDILRIRDLTERYADLPLGFADACVIACAERHGHGVMTLDRRDFEVVQSELPLELLPALS